MFTRTKTMQVDNTKKIAFNDAPQFAPESLVWRFREQCRERGYHKYDRADFEGFVGKLEDVRDAWE